MPLSSPEKLVSDFWNSVNNHSIVNVNILSDRNVQIVESGGNQIVVIEVLRVDRHDKPVYTEVNPFAGTYRRNGEGDYRCTKDEVRAMMRDQADISQDTRVMDEGNSSAWKDKLDTNRSVEKIFRSAQKQFNAWSKLAPSQRTTEQLMRMLDFDFFEILDAVTIARSRQHIEKYYNIEEIGNFPTRLPPVTKQPPLTDLNNAITYDEIYELILSLTLSIYTPSNYILPSRLKKYADLNHEGKNNLTQAGREEGIRRLMSINLLKRLESSVHSFRLTLQRIRDMIAATLDTIHTYDPHKIIELKDLTGAADFDADDMENNLFTVGRKVKIALEDMDYLTWQRDLQTDFETLQLLLGMVADITPGHDSKLQTLLQTLTEKQREPLNKDNRKVLIFTAFSDTAQYLYEQVGAYMLRSFGLHTALVTGSVEGRSTVPKFKADLNNALTCFSPVPKDRAALMPDGPDIDILIATDCISEGQNLQDCDCVINYDIHWNPVRLVQRFGRIINNQKADMIIEHITYNMLEESYSADIFMLANLHGRQGVNAMPADRSLYNYVIYDSDNERRFAHELDVCDKIAVYVKLPGSFFISTPVGKYNPDWAIAFHEGTVKHIYFIAETKGTTLLDRNELRGVEDLKIQCAKAHFAAISNHSAVYDVVDSYDKLMQVVME